MKGLRPLAQLMKEVKSIDKSQINIPSVFIYSTALLILTSNTAVQPKSSLPMRPLATQAIM